MTSKTLVSTTFDVMNYLDLILVIPIIWFGWQGFTKGLIIEIFTLLALLVGIYVGINFSDFAADILRNDMGFTSEYMPVIAFTITFLAVGALVYFAGVMIEKAVNLVALKMFNKLLGMLLGVIKALFLISVIIVIFEGYDREDGLIDQQTKKGSLLYQPIKFLSLNTISPLRYSDMYLDMDSVENDGPKSEEQDSTSQGEKKIPDD